MSRRIVPAGRVTRTVPARPRASLLDVALQLAQAGVLAVALGVLIAPAPAPERTTYSRPATQEEIQRHTDARLDWQLHHPQP